MKYNVDINVNIINITIYYYLFKMHEIEGASPYIKQS